MSAPRPIRRRRLVAPLLAVGGVLLSACGGGGGSSAPPAPQPSLPQPPSNSPPTAHAGFGQLALLDAEVTLYGGLSQDADGDNLSYR